MASPSFEFFFPAEEGTPVYPRWIGWTSGGPRLRMARPGGHRALAEGETENEGGLLKKTGACIRQSGYLPEGEAVAGPRS